MHRSLFVVTTAVLAHATMTVAWAQPAPARDASARAVARTNAIRATYDRGIRFQDELGRFQLRLNLRNQFRFESTRPTESNAQFSSHFVIPRSRLSADGFMWGDCNRFKVELSLGDTGNFAFVRDAYVERRIGDRVWIRAGQWKRPFNRQEIVSDFASEMNERAHTARFSGSGRDLGAAIHNDYERSPDGVEWAVGVFNSFDSGADRPSVATTCTQNPMTGAITCVSMPATTVPADFGPTLVARLGWNSGGIRGYSEGDLEGGGKRTSLAVSYKIDLANLARGNEASVADNLSHGLELDAMVKVHGFGIIVGGYLMKRKSADPQLGGLIQPGYFIVPRTAQVAARFAISPSGTRTQIEARAAFNWFWEGHAWKWATDAGFVQLTGRDPTTMATDSPDLQLRTMLQLTM